MTNWTPEQQEAIENRGGTLLVSAAAGSGKTAVLTERVVRRLTDENDPAEMDELLLVTFTNAAAAEMRERIAAALSQRAALRPQDKRLRRQLYLIHRAQIMTVHACCLQLAREHAAALGIAPDFRLMDEKEGQLLRAEVLEELLEQKYEQAEPPFFALSDLLTSGQNDKKLGEVVLRTYDKIQGHPDPRAFLERVRRGLYAPDMNTPQGRELKEQARLAAEYGRECLRRALLEMVGDTLLEQAYVPAFSSDFTQADTFLKMLMQGSWDEIAAVAGGLHFDRLGSTRGYEDKALLNRVKALREEWKTVAKLVSQRYFSTSEQAALEDRAMTASAMEALVDTVLAFDAAYDAAKRARNIADFNDLEHFAMRLLYQGGAVSPLAKSLSARYKEILVDEYQDTNAVQDAIFLALSREGENLFFVGDVKQSIYGFRLADPSIFLKKYQSFADVPQAQDGAARRVVLGQNFRSRAAVLDACNFIFSDVMGELVGGMDYTDREALHVGATYAPVADSDYKTEVLLVQAPGRGGEEDEDSPEKSELEAKLVAMRIRTMLDGGMQVSGRAGSAPRPLRPDDIAVLLRSPKTKAETFIAAIEEVGLPAAAEERGGLLYTSEVGTIVSFLSVIDNPRQDIDLIGVMRSPLFGFSEQQLADIRLRDKNVSFYEALVLYAQQDEACAAFLQRLQRLRAEACDLPVYRLIWKIYDETGALGLYGAWPEGPRRQSNLLAFFERARAFEEQGYRGLFRFVRLLGGMMENGEDFQTAVGGDAVGAIHIMSIHKSKGLEFPVVFLADCAKQFNEQDLREPVLVQEKLGLGCKCRDRARGIQYNTAERTAVAASLRREMVSEELRVLYVAMTRAQEKLVLTCASAALENSLARWAQLAALQRLPQYALGAMRSPLGWVMTPLLRHPCTRALREQYGLCVPERKDAPDAFSVKIYLPEELHAENMPQAARAEENAMEDTALPEIVMQPHFDYENAYLKDLPSKLTATGIGRGYRADEAAEDATSRAPDVRETKLREPVFSAAGKKLTPAQVGTAHHLFMQFCRFEIACTPEGAAQELVRLRENRIITPEQADAVDLEKISGFFASPLFRETMAKAQVRREFKFSVLAPAGKYFPVAENAPDEHVLLQGVIDCLLEQPDGFVVVDFKTDRVRAQDAPQRAEQYRMQLEAYADAVHEIFGRPVLGKILYFFSSGTTVQLP